jgi:hypothetical protein
MFKRASSKKYVIIVFLTIVIAVIAYTVFRQINPRVGFKYFEPAYLPPSTSIKEKRISIRMPMTELGRLEPLVRIMMPKA